MSCKNDFLPIQSRKQRCLLDSSSSRHASSSTRTWHSRITSLPSHSCSSQADADLLDPLDDITLDIDLDQRSASSATLLSRRVSSSLSTNKFLTDASSESNLSTRLSESRQSRFLYPLHEPGQMTAQRTQRLRARTAAVIMSIPATCEDVIDVDDHESRKVPPVAQASKLRRVSGVRDLRRAFRDADHGPVHCASISSLGVSKVCFESARRFNIYSPSSLGFIRARLPCSSNPTAVPAVPSLLTPYTGGCGQCSVPKVWRCEDAMRVHTQFYIHFFSICHKTPFYFLPVADVTNFPAI